MAAWNLEYTLEVISYLKNNHLNTFNDISAKLKLRKAETDKWWDIVDKMYFPKLESLNVFEQQDGYMDKEQQSISDLSEGDLPFNQNWSWTEYSDHALLNRPMSYKVYIC